MEFLYGFFLMDDQLERYIFRCMLFIVIIRIASCILPRSARSIFIPVNAIHCYNGIAGMNTLSILPRSTFDHTYSGKCYTFYNKQVFSHSAEIVSVGTYSGECFRLKFSTAGQRPGPYLIRERCISAYTPSNLAIEWRKETVNKKCVAAQNLQ